jgi:hypothetical protein
MKNELRTLLVSVAMLALSACGSNENGGRGVEAGALIFDDGGNVKLPGRGANSDDGGMVTAEDGPGADVGGAEASIANAAVDAPSPDGSAVAMDVPALALDAASRDAGRALDAATIIGGLDAPALHADGGGVTVDAESPVDTSPTATATGTATETATSTSTDTSTATSTDTPTMTMTSTGNPTLTLTYHPTITLTYHPTLTLTSTITRVIIPPTLTPTDILTATLIDTATTVNTDTSINTGILTRTSTEILTNTSVLTATKVTLPPVTTPVGPVLGIQ